MRTIAIVVLYNDNTIEVANNISMIAKQVDKVCLVDNSDVAYPERFSRIANAIYMPQYQNKGIAAAQNIGLRYAMEQEVDYVLFADPDTTITSEAVSCLLSTFQKLASSSFHVGGIGSVARNKATKQYYPLRSNLLQELPELNVKEVTYTMNSISLYPIQLFQEVGMMDEALFIDGVDSEFCWRATSLIGVKFFLDNSVVIEHMLGMGTKVIGGKERSITPPYRMYYQYRNYLWLARRSYTPKSWLRENGLRYLVKMIYYPLFKSPRLAYIKYILKGITDGIKQNNS